MRKILKLDWAISPIMIFPFLLLKLNWSDIPGKILIHWNGISVLKSKYILLYACLLPIAAYLILLIPAFLPIPSLKRKILNSGEKYFSLKFGVVLLLSLIDWIIFWHFKYNNMPPVLPGY